MAEIIRMPRMSDTMEEGVIAKWLKKVGDTVKSGDVLAEVETDKATMELESYTNGVILYLGVEEKRAVHVNGVIAIIGKKSENIDELIKQSKTEVIASKPAEPEKPGPVIMPVPDAVKINASVVTMPRMSDTMTEGTISKWHKKVGDSVKSGDVLADVDTDKATMELEAYENGTLLYIGVDEGKSVAVDGVIAVIGEKGADYQTLIKSMVSKTGGIIVEAAARPEVKASRPAEPAFLQTDTKISHNQVDGRLKASPLAKKLANEKGYDLRSISGSGEAGRIIKRDVENFKPGKAVPGLTGTKTKEGMGLPSYSDKESFSEVPVTQMRKTIARRLAESKFSAPHFYLTMEINMDRAIDVRKAFVEADDIKISFNDIILKACALALRKHPKVNVSWLGDRIRYNQHIHIGVAVAMEEGLVVPVVRFADGKSLPGIAAEVKELGSKARNKQLQPKDWEGNTFTISNLGMFGIEEFTAIINPPDACILAVGGIKQTAVVRDGNLVIGNVMKVTLSCDHRAVDGATGAAFLLTVKELLENPVKLFI